MLTIIVAFLSGFLLWVFAILVTILKEWDEADKLIHWTLIKQIEKLDDGTYKYNGKIYSPIKMNIWDTIYITNK